MGLLVGAVGATDWATFCATLRATFGLGGALKVLFCDLPVVLLGDQAAVAEPLRGNMGRVLGGQLRGSAGP